MPVQSTKQDQMNEAVADLVIRVAQSVKPEEVTPDQLKALSDLVSSVNYAPTPLMAVGTVNEL